MDEYGTEEQCREPLFRLRWPSGFDCPECGRASYNPARLEKHKLMQVMYERQQDKRRPGRIQMDAAYLGS